MPQVDVPNQFGDPTLSPDEAASACGPAAAVAFARANGRNPTLREAVDLAKRVGWTAGGGMNGIGNQKRLLDAMGIASELDTNASPDGIRQRVQAGQDVTVSTPIHYYVVDAVDRQGRVHVGQSGLARRGGAEWMTLEDIASRDGGINGALYQTVSDTGGQQPVGGAGVDTTGDRPPSEFEPPSRFTPTPPTPTRVSKMQTQIEDLRRQRQALEARMQALLQPGPDETPAGPLRSDVEVAHQANQNRRDQLDQVRQQAAHIDAQISSLTTDLANDPDAKSVTQDPVAAEKARVELERAKFQLQQEQQKAAAATDPTAKRLQDLEVRKAEIALEQAQLNLEQDRNPRAPQRAPQTPEEIAQARLNLTKTQQEIDKNARGLLPAQVQVVQGLHDTITMLQGMYEKGQIQLPEMNAYVEIAKSAADAQMRGTTPADEAAAKAKAKRDDQSLGMGLINQRLVSGTGLANTLMSAATGPHVMLRPGQQSLGVDPLEGLRGLVDSLGGGQGVGDYARSLLLGAQGPPTAVPPMHAGL